MRAFDFELNDRASLLLKRMVECYIRDGEPVSSQTLSRETQLGSAATVRNVMAHLEEQGLITSPHTSAGRIPTALGYRFFVDTLVTSQMPQDEEKREVQEVLSPDRAQDDLIQGALQLLCQLTPFASLMTLPCPERQVLRHVEFVPLDGRRVLVILVLNEKEVQNRIIRLEEPISPVELQEIANFLNHEFSGVDLKQTEARLLRALEVDRKQINRLMLLAVNMARQAFGKTQTQADFLIRGEANLLSIAKESGVQKLQQLFHAFSQKQAMLGVLQQMIDAQSLQVYIGEEAGLEALRESSIITAPYTLSGQVVGVLGVIGPTRMPYDRVLPLVDMTAKLLSVALNFEEKPPQ